MASTVPTTSSTRETTNFARLCRLLVDLGTGALKKVFDGLILPGNLQATLAANETTLRSLIMRKILNASQWEKLFPADRSTVSSDQFDITLLMVLLRNICGLPDPVTGWDALPAPTCLTTEDDIARIKYYRNMVYAHAERASLDDAKFENNWKEIGDTLERLGGAKYREHIDHIKTQCMDPEAESDHLELLKRWEKDDINVKDMLEKVSQKLDKLDPEGLDFRAKKPQSCSASKKRYHENKPAECQDCRVCMCPKWGPTSHNHLSQADKQQATEERKTYLSKILDKVKEKRAEIETKMNTQREFIKVFKDDWDSVKKHITESVEERIRLLEEHKRIMTDKLNVICWAEDELQNKRLRNMKWYAQELDSSRNLGQAFKKRTMDIEFSEEECEKVINNLEEVLKAKTIDNYYKPRRVSYIDCEETVSISLFGDVLAMDGNLSPSTREEEKVNEEKFATVSSRDLETNKSEEKLIGQRKGALQRYNVVSNSLSEHHVRRKGILTPYSIAVCGRNETVALTECFRNQVHLFDCAWNHLKAIGSKNSTGGELIKRPLSVAFAKSGDVVVIQGWSRSNVRRKMSVFTEHGDFVMDLTDHLIHPRSVSVAGNGDLIVCDLDKVKVLSPDGKDLKQTIRFPLGEAPTRAVRHQDVLYVLFTTECCVGVFKNDRFFNKFGRKGSGDGQLLGPTDLTIDSHGNLVVCDKGNKRIQVFSLQGKFLYSVNKGLNGPRGVAIDKDGDLLLCDLISVRVLSLDP